MSLSAVGTSMPQYQIPKTPQAAIDDERSESVAVKQKEDATGKDAPAPVKKSAHAVDVKA